MSLDLVLKSRLRSLLFNYWLLIGHVVFVILDYIRLLKIFSVIIVVRKAIVVLNLKHTWA